MYISLSAVLSSRDVFEKYPSTRFLVTGLAITMVCMAVVLIVALVYLKKSKSKAVYETKSASGFENAMYLQSPEDNMFVTGSNGKFISDGIEKI